jgi:hypothetical protein
MIEDFPDENYDDDDLRSVIKEDLKRSLRSSSRGTSRSSTTARPESRATIRSFIASDNHSQDVTTHHAGPSALLHQGHTFTDGDRFVHTGARKMPASVKHAAGPLSVANFVQLGIEKNQVKKMLLVLWY